MELQIPTAEPVMVERQEPLTASLVDHLFLYHKCTKTMPFRPKGGEVYTYRLITDHKLCMEYLTSVADRCTDSLLNHAIYTDQITEHS